MRKRGQIGDGRPVSYNACRMYNLFLNSPSLTYCRFCSRRSRRQLSTWASRLFCHCTPLGAPLASYLTLGTGSPTSCPSMKVGRLPVECPPREHRDKDFIQSFRASLKLKTHFVT